MSERVLIRVSRMLGFVLRVLLREASLVPAFHSNLGVVRRSQSFLVANGDYPLIDRLLVGLL